MQTVAWVRMTNVFHFSMIILIFQTSEVGFRFNIIYSLTYSNIMSFAFKSAFCIYLFIVHSRGYIITQKFNAIDSIQFNSISTLLSSKIGKTQENPHLIATI